jgi:hypothetical protein
LKIAAQLSADNRKVLRIYRTVLRQAFAEQHYRHAANPYLSVGVPRCSELFVDEDLVIADPGHPLRSRQMASVSAFGALGLSIRVDMQY